MNIETQLYLLYASSLHDPLLPVTGRQEGNILRPIPLEKASQQFNLTDDKIYASYFHEAFRAYLERDTQDDNLSYLLPQLQWDEILQTPNVQALLSNENVLCDVDAQIAKMLFHAGYDYLHILRILTNSVRVFPQEGKKIPSDEERLHMALLTVIRSVNPVVSMPNVQVAKPLAQIHLDTSTPEEIYSSILRFVFDKNPAIHLNEADEQVVQILSSNGMDEKAVAACMKCSFNLKKCTLQELLDFIALAMEPVHKESRSIEDDDEFLEETMHTNLRILLANEKMWNIQSYWQDAMTEIADTLNYVKKAEYGAKIIHAWTENYQEAAKEFNMDVPPSVQEIFDKADGILEKGVEDDAQGWSVYYELLDKISQMTQAFAGEIAASVVKQPLLQVPEIACSVPLGNVENSGKLSPQELYFSAIKEAVMKHPGIGIYEADKLAFNEMKTRNIPQGDIRKALSISPRLEYLPPSKRKADADCLAKYLAEGKSQQQGGR